MRHFLQKNRKKTLGHRPQTTLLPTAGGFASDSHCLRRLKAPLPDPRISPLTPRRIPGYAPGPFYG